MSGQGKIRLPRTAAINGANAAGKGNFPKAIDVMKAVVASSKNLAGRLPVQPFRLNPDCAAKPRKFDMTFFVNGARCQCGFAATASKVLQAWLYALKVNNVKHLTTSSAPLTGMNAACSTGQAKKPKRAV
ncbi:MAG: hypothetical protein OXB95_11000 [Rhodobacteraceae bacterium]|nr:hypothetical protein [Paracoccaceae bacterium]